MVKNNITCHIKTESENALVQSFLFHNGFRWSGPIPYFTLEMLYLSQTCLFITNGTIYLSYGSISYAKREKYKVLEIAEFCEAIQNYMESKR